MKTLVVLAVLPLAIAVPLAGAAPPPKAGDFTIAAKPSPIVFGQTTSFSGKLKGTKAAVPITLQGKPAPFTGAFGDVATANTSTKGDYVINGTRPQRNTRYRVVTTVAPVETSAELLVEVQIKVVLRLSDRTPAAGQRVRFYGTAAPDHDGRTVYIQRRTTTGAWRTVKKATLRDAGSKLSKFSKRIRVRRDNTYRALVFHDADHADGTSSSKSADVH
jgi:hypothetical protein